MPKKKKGLADFLPPGWEDWTQEEQEDWLRGKKPKKSKRTKASMGPVGMMPENYGGAEWR